MSNLSTLRERVAAATGADRDLDLAIWNAVNDAGETWHWIAPQEGRGASFATDGVITCYRYEPGATGNPACSLEPYTASLDAALALVEAKLPGWGWDVSTVTWGRGGYTASMHRPASNDEIAGCAPTPALALLAALLAALDVDTPNV